MSSDNVLADRKFSRRQWLRALGWYTVALGLFDQVAIEAFGQRQAPPTSVPPLNRFPRMVQEFFVEQVRAAEQAGLAERRGLQTSADAEAYVRTVREKIRRCFGPFPEKTPLNQRVTGRVERESYHIEKILFESRPGFLVTANLYVPQGRQFPLPGVVGSCGHSTNGKT